MHALPILLLILISFSAFFAMAEVAFVSLNKIRLRYLLARGEKNADIVHRIVKKMDKLITTILVGNNFVNIAISALGTALFITLFGNTFLVVAAASLVVTLLVLILGEITPKIFAVKHAERISLRVAWFMDGIINALDPIVKVFLAISNRLLRLFGEESPRRSPLVTQEEIRLMIELGSEEGVVSAGERSMLHRIFEFGKTLVKDAMLPADKIVALDITTAGADELLDTIVEEGHSRIPIYEGTLNNIRGIVYGRELLNVWRNRELVVIQDLLHPPVFVPPDKRVSELLREFQKTRVYMAIVVDDKKNTLGLVTLEDLLEEIVGEIEENAG